MAKMEFGTALALAREFIRDDSVAIQLASKIFDTWLDGYREGCDFVFKRLGEQALKRSSLP